jgi:protein gp37
MAENTLIAWAHDTFNGWEGCQKVSPECDNCYAETRAGRWGTVEWGPGKPRRRTSASNWAKPRRWNAEALAKGKARRVFCSSLSDVFDNAADPAWRVDLFDLIRDTPGLTWMLLTKRPENVLKQLSQAQNLAREAGNMTLWAWLHAWLAGKPPTNVWLGVSAGAQLEVDRRVPILLALPARARFLSAEPLLSGIQLASIPMRIDGALVHVDALRGEHYLPGAGSISSQTFTGKPRLDLVIVGGESGALDRVRRFDFAWADALARHCAAAGVAFFFKQGGRLPALNGEPLTLKHPKGEDPAEWPVALRVQQIPEHLHAPLPDQIAR